MEIIAQELNEFVVAMLALGTLLFIALNWRRLVIIPHMRLMIASFMAIALGFFMSAAENFGWTGFLNIVEHLGYMAAMIFFALWVRQACMPSGEAKP